MILLLMVSSFGIGVVGILLIIVKPRFAATSNTADLARKSVMVFAIPLLVGAIVWLITKLVVLAVSSAVATFIIVRRRRMGRPNRDERAFVDALATWTEQIRDTLAGAHGLEEAIFATAPRAPKEVRSEVQRLVAYMTYGSTSQGLRQFAEDLDHPTADFVVSALLTATQYQARDLVTLLSHVAECARDEGRMRSRVWVSRARTRSSVKIISGVVVAFVGGLFLFSAEYLAPYSTVNGQLILLIIGAVFVSAFVLMQRMSAVAMPERFVRKRVTS